MRMDRQTNMTTLIVAFHNFAITPKIHWERELGSGNVTVRYFVSLC